MEEREIQIIRGGWSNVADYLKCKSDLKEMGLRPGVVVAKVWNSYMWVDLFDVNECKPKRKRTPKQLEALEKGRQKARENRTCQVCNRYYVIGCYEDFSIAEHYKDGIEKRMCSSCQKENSHQIYLLGEKESALEILKMFHENKEDILILKTETTGVDYPVCVEVSLINLDGDTVFYSLINPNYEINNRAQQIHGITNKMVKLAPNFPDIWCDFEKIIKGKYLTSFTWDLDVSSIRNTFNRLEKPVPDKFFFETTTYNTCLQELYGNLSMTEYPDYKYIKIAEALGEDYAPGIKGKSIAYLRILYKMWKNIGLIDSVPDFIDTKSKNNVERMEWLLDYVQKNYPDEEKEGFIKAIILEEMMK